jgi:hypothetical protein
MRRTTPTTLELWLVALAWSAVSCGGNSTAQSGSGGGAGMSHGTGGTGGVVGSGGATTDAGSGGTAGVVGTAGASGVPVHHRAADSTCPAERGPGNGAGLGAGECAMDADCSAGDNGRCLVSGPAPYSYCSYDQCFDDGDCAGLPCECRTSASSYVANVCVTGSNCRVDSDCGVDGYCSPSRLNQWCGTAYYCHTAADTCVNDTDCADSGCNYDAQAGHWSCGGDCGPPPP